MFGWIVGFAFLGIFVRQLLTSQQDLGAAFARLDWRYVGVGLLFFIAGHALYALLPLLAHRVLRHPLTTSQAYRYWFSSQLAKYLPGGLWIVPARAIFYTQNGLPVVVAGVTVTWEVLSILSAGLLFGLADGAATSSAYGTLIALGSLVLWLGLLFSQTVWPWRLLVRLRIMRAQKMLDSYQQIGTNRLWLLLGLTAVNIVIWLVIGTGFYFLTLSSGQALVSWFHAVSTYAVAWSVGFLVFITPAGLGPRETAVVALIGPQYGTTMAFTLALVARVCWIAGETVHIAIAAIMDNGWLANFQGKRRPSKEAE